MKDSKVLNVKDLINAGLFSVLIFVFTFLAGMIGMIPGTMMIMPCVIGVVTGPIYMLYSTKIRKPGMIMIQQLILALVFVVTGHGPWIVLTTATAAFIAEIIIKKDNYLNLSSARLAFSITPLGFIGNFIPIFLNRDKVFAKIAAKRGLEAAQRFSDNIPNWIVAPSIILAVVGGFIGCTIGIHLLKKHFIKAGMIKDK